MPETHIDRMVVERDELNERLNKARKFMETETFYGLNGEDQNDLRDQVYAMAHYSEVLSRRIARAKGWIKPMTPTATLGVSL